MKQYVTRRAPVTNYAGAATEVEWTAGERGSGLLGLLDRLVHNYFEKSEAEDSWKGTSCIPQLFYLQDTVQLSSN